jgi:hypothetical protein
MRRHSWSVEDRIIVDRFPRCDEPASSRQLMLSTISTSVGPAPRLPDTPNERDQADQRPSEERFGGGPAWTT